MQILNSRDAQEIQDKLITLHQIQFCARYGDYFADICSHIKAKIAEQKIDGWRYLSKRYWTEIQRKIIEETKFYQEFCETSHGFEKCPTSYTVDETCRRIGYDPKGTFVMIELYASRNQVMHSDFATMIKEGRWT